MEENCFYTTSLSDDYSLYCHLCSSFLSLSQGKNREKLVAFTPSDFEPTDQKKYFDAYDLFRKEHRLRAFENRVLRRIFGPKRYELTKMINKAA
jgi:hypothetical protein